MVNTCSMEAVVEALFPGNTMELIDQRMELNALRCFAYGIHAFVDDSGVVGSDLARILSRPTREFANLKAEKNIYSFGSFFCQ